MSFSSTQAAPAPKLPMTTAIADSTSRRRSAVKSRRVSRTLSVAAGLFMVLQNWGTRFISQYDIILHERPDVRHPQKAEPASHAAPRAGAARLQGPGGIPLFADALRGIQRA